MHAQVKDILARSEAAMKAGQLDYAEALIDQARRVKAGQPAGQVASPQEREMFQDAVKRAQQARLHELKIERAMETAYKAESLAEIDPEAQKLADELHGGDYSAAAYRKHRAYYAFIKGLPVDDADARAIILSPAELLDAVQRGVSAKELKATVQESQDTLGGFAVANVVAERIRGRAATLSVVRPRAFVDSAGVAGSVGVPIVTGGNDTYASGLRGNYTSETQDITGLEENIRMGMVKPPVNLWRLRAKLSKSLMQDGGPRLSAVLEYHIALAKAVKEDAAFLVGTGAGEPLGILALQAPGVLMNGDVRVVNSGNANTITGDGIINTLYALPGHYRSAPSFAIAMKAATLKVVRLLKDASGRYVFDADSHTIDGYPVAESESMPDIAANAFPILFGDFEGYSIVDRVETSIQRHDDANTAQYDEVWFDARARYAGTPAEGYRFAALKVAA